MAACPPVVEYSAEFRARAADELKLLPEGSAVVEMHSDYAVMREQARACGFYKSDSLNFKTAHWILFTSADASREAGPSARLTN